MLHSLFVLNLQNPVYILHANTSQFRIDPFQFLKSHVCLLAVVPHNQASGLVIQIARTYSLSVYIFFILWPVVLTDVSYL